jgi:UPF0755 protein
LQIYKQAHEMLMSHLRAAWDKRDRSLPYATPYEALIMASIVEKETGQKNERAMIAGVFVNRLKLGMLLQTDPTVIYGMGAKYAGKIGKRDLETDTPYNTYVRAGLPPTPIALPGLQSLAAALAPAQTEALYFVSRGDGTSQFSGNLNDHNRAVNQYQRRAPASPPTSVSLPISSPSTARPCSRRASRAAPRSAKSCASCCCTKRCISKPRRC